VTSPRSPELYAIDDSALGTTGARGVGTTCVGGADVVGVGGADDAGMGCERRYPFIGYARSGGVGC
jgi:hypothetical protein